MSSVVSDTRFLRYGVMYKVVRRRLHSHIRHLVESEESWRRVFDCVELLELLWYDWNMMVKGRWVADQSGYFGGVVE